MIVPSNRWAMTLSLDDLDSHLFKCADIIRNTVDKTDYKDYILPLVFYKSHLGYIRRPIRRPSRGGRRDRRLGVCLQLHLCDSKAYRFRRQPIGSLRTPPSGDVL
ncbi:MAG: type I restriction-modification system subunit M N-terminal domain-containing protein [Natrialbaceae archaeon]|nr:type I restriction-modification system subunit M N-terminal domain-containing protein [Natrialbaceae archaeon]